ncbi:hypothetical protein V4B17_02570 [Bartonella sp. B23]
MVKRTFGVETSCGARFNYFKIEASLELLCQRLARVAIENTDWSDFILRYDK